MCDLTLFDPYLPTRSSRLNVSPVPCLLSRLPLSCTPYSQSRIPVTYPSTSVGNQDPEWSGPVGSSWVWDPSHTLSHSVEWPDRWGVPGSLGRHPQGIPALCHLLHKETSWELSSPSNPVSPDTRYSQLIEKEPSSSPGVSLTYNLIVSGLFRRDFVLVHSLSGKRVWESSRSPDPKIFLDLNENTQ